MTVYILHENGDDYHGSNRIVAVFDNLSSATESKEYLEANQVPCEDCGHTYWYSIEEQYLRDCKLRETQSA